MVQTLCLAQKQFNFRGLKVLPKQKSDKSFRHSTDWQHLQSQDYPTGNFVRLLFAIRAKVRLITKCGTFEERRTNSAKTHIAFWRHSQLGAWTIDTDSHAI